MNKVTTEIDVYEVHGKETNALDGPKLTVRSHWNDDDKVVLVFGASGGASRSLSMLTISSWRSRTRRTREVTMG